MGTRGTRLQRTVLGPREYEIPRVASRGQDLMSIARRRSVELLLSRFVDRARVFPGRLPSRENRLFESS